MSENVKLNLIISNIIGDATKGIVSSDDVFISYKNVFSDIVSAGTYSNIISHRLITYLKKAYPTFVTNTSHNATISLYTQIFNKINALIGTINTNFFINYISIADSINDPLMTFKDKIQLLDSCLRQGEEIGSVIFEREYYGALLSALLEDIPDSLGRIDEISAKLKLINAKVDTIPIEIFKY